MNPSLYRNFLHIFFYSGRIESNGSEQALGDSRLSKDDARVKDPSRQGAVLAPEKRGSEQESPMADLINSTDGGAIKFGSFSLGDVFE
jgi:hypothetical protein